MTNYKDEILFYVDSHDTVLCGKEKTLCMEKAVVFKWFLVVI